MLSDPPWCTYPLLPDICVRATFVALSQWTPTRLCQADRTISMELSSNVTTPTTSMSAPAAILQPPLPPLRPSCAREGARTASIWNTCSDASSSPGSGTRCITDDAIRTACRTEYFCRALKCWKICRFVVFSTSSAKDAPCHVLLHVAYISTRLPPHTIMATPTTGTTTPQPSLPHYPPPQAWHSSPHLCLQPLWEWQSNALQGVIWFTSSRLGVQVCSPKDHDTIPIPCFCKGRSGSGSR